MGLREPNIFAYVEDGGVKTAQFRNIENIKAVL